VATVAINNSVNAALLAIQILGSSDLVIQQRVQEYRSNMQQEVLGNARRLGTEGWQDFEKETK
jgi:phosphoribosylcarboxyaminoimidazole (NCAIR) mutase